MRISNSNFCWFFNRARNETNVIRRQWEHALSSGIWWQCIWKLNSGSLQMQDAARLWIPILSYFSETCVKSLASDAKVRVFLRVQVSGWSGAWCRNWIFWSYFNSAGNENECSLEEITVYSFIWNTNCNTYEGLTLAACRCKMCFSLQIMFQFHFESCEKWWGNNQVWYHILHEALNFVAKLAFWRDSPSWVVLGKAAKFEFAEFNFQTSPKFNTSSTHDGKMGQWALIIKLSFQKVWADGS